MYYPPDRRRTNFHHQQYRPQPPHLPMNPYSQSHYYHMNHPPQKSDRKFPTMFKAAFTDDKGQLNIGKSLETMDQVVKTVHQVTPLVRQVSSLFTKK